MKFEKSVLVLTHSNYLVTDAGVEKVIQGQQKLFLQNHINFIVVYPIRQDMEIFGWVHSRTMSNYGLIINGETQGEIDYPEMLNLLETKDLLGMIIHELVTFKKDEKLFLFFDKVQCPIYYFVHDYAMVCYNHVLMRNNKEFCGTEPLSFSKCKNCRFYIEGKLNEKWQRKFVERYPQIVYLFPSTVVRDIWQNHFQAKNELRIVPNTKFGSAVSPYPAGAGNKKLRIAFIGYGRVEKGWDTWKKLCENYDRKYELYILGDGECPGEVKKCPVSVAKDGPNAMIDTISKHQIDIAFLWSTVPETYSYTFFESYVSGCYVLTNEKSGNICAMTRQYACGRVLESEEALFAYLAQEQQVKEDLEIMYAGKGNHPVSLENNDEILKLIKGESI